MTGMPRAVQGSWGILSRDPGAADRIYLLLGPLGLSAAPFLGRGHVSCSSSHPQTPSHGPTAVTTGRAWGWRVTRGRDSDPTFPNLLLPATAGGAGGKEHRSGPSSSSPPPWLFVPEPGRWVSLPAQWPQPGFICQPITPCSPPPPHCVPTRVPALWQPRAGSIPSASRERRRMRAHGRGKGRDGNLAERPWVSDHINQAPEPSYLTHSSPSSCQ